MNNRTREALISVLIDADCFLTQFELEQVTVDEVDWDDLALTRCELTNFITLLREERSLADEND